MEDQGPGPRGQPHRDTLLLQQSGPRGLGGRQTPGPWYSPPPPTKFTLSPRGTRRIPYPAFHPSAGLDGAAPSSMLSVPTSGAASLHANPSTARCFPPCAQTRPTGPLTPVPQEPGPAGCHHGCPQVRTGPSTQQVPTQEGLTCLLPCFSCPQRTTFQTGSVQCNPSNRKHLRPACC